MDPTRAPASTAGTHSAVDAPATSSSLDALLNLYLASSPLLPDLSAHVTALLDHRVWINTRQQLDVLRSELHEDWARRAWAVKADYMARVVPAHGVEQDPSDMQAQGADVDHAAEGAESSPLPPTILSDADGATEMAKRVDGTVEAALDGQVTEAWNRIAASVQRNEAMELEVWLGQEILDAFSTAAGDEAQAARFVLDRLEDACEEAGISVA